MNVLVIGSGGREHAIVQALVRSPHASELWCAPGNPGIDAEGARCVDLPLGDVDAVAAWAQAEAIDLVVVGPEGPLVDGLVDRCAERGVAAFGPTAAAARLEGSKAFAKEVMDAAGVPTAAHAAFDELDAAVRFVRAPGVGPVVVKADGLAAGKGVVVCDDADQAEAALRTMLADDAYGTAGRRVVVEERLDGPELSVLALVSGEQVRVLLPARDHKRAHDGDAGPNTGGMGAYAPVAEVDGTLLARVEHEVLVPVARELVRRGTPYRGVLYAGLMLTADGPKVIEFNARFGDPEAQVVLPLLRSDLLDALRATVDGTLDGLDLRWSDGAAVTVVVAAPGYPEAPRTGQRVEALPELVAGDGVTVFHAGTATSRAGELVVRGGRTFTVTAMAADVAAARSRAYEAAREIDFDGAWMRTDIAADALVRRVVVAR